MVAEMGGVEVVRQVMQVMREAAEADRLAVLAELRANQSLRLGEDDLKVMSLEALKRLRDSLKPADYSGRGLPRNDQRPAVLVEAPMPNVK
jgi:hypothetical protein